MKKAMPGIVFAVLIAALALMQPAFADRTHSENENRFLQTLPEFSWSGLVSGEFTTDFDQYITDQFPFRDEFVGMKTWLERASGKHDSGGVYLCEDGSLIEMFTQINAQRYEENMQSVWCFVDAAQEEGIRTWVMLAPTASGMLKDSLPAYAPEIDQASLLAQAAAGHGTFVNVMDALAEHKDDYIYYRTDHHWTSLGAYRAYAAWKEQAGEVPAPLSAFEARVLSAEFLGTTYSKANLHQVEADVITAYESATPPKVEFPLTGEGQTGLYTQTYLQGKDKYSAFLNGNQPSTIIHGFGDEGKKLLLIKDSYANCFAQFLVYDYAQIHLIDLRYNKQSMSDYAKENGIDEILILYNLKGFQEDVDIQFLR